MALPWKQILTKVPWKDVLDKAPTIADGARKMWNNLGRNSAEPAASLPPDADLAKRLSVLEMASQQLQAQMLASGELIQALSEQNARLVTQIEIYRQRAQRQAWGLALTALVAGLALLLAWQPHLLEFFA